MARFFTAGTVGGDKDSLTTFRAGAAWVYADARSTFLRVAEAHAERVWQILETQLLCQMGYLFVLCKRDAELRGYEREYIGYLANLACALGGAEKILCQPVDGAPYGSYHATRHGGRVEAALMDLHRRLDENWAVRYKEAARDIFGGVTGSYYWAKSLAEHLVYLGLASSGDEWSIRR